MKTRYLLIPFALGLGIVLALVGVLGGGNAPAVAAPALSQVEGPALSQVEGPALSQVEGPALSQENLASLAAPVSGASPRGQGSERLHFPVRQVKGPVLLAPSVAKESADGTSVAKGPRAGPLPSVTEDYIEAPNVPAAELQVCPNGCAYSSVQDAVDAANDGDVIKVATGTYTGVQGRAAPAGYNGPSVITQVVYISKTVTIRGGYTTAFTDPPDPEANPTTLDAKGQGRVLFIGGDPSAPDGTSASGQAISPAVEGLRITGGDAAGLGGGSSGQDAGGGAYIISAMATISDNQVFSSAASVGGGLYLNDSAATLSGNTIRSNIVTDAGGGLYLWFSDATLNDNTITTNTAHRGGGLFLVESAATLDANTLASNTVTYSGGGLFLWFSDVTFINNIIADNQSNSAGSGLSIVSSSPHLLHTTIARNSGGDDSSGVYITNGTVALTNTILVSHTVGVYLASGDSTARLEGTLWGSGAWANDTDWGGGGTIITGTPAYNYWGDPAFVRPDAGDYHISRGSAAVDAGVNAGVTVDIDGERRPLRTGYDIGADELPEYIYIYLPLVLRQSS